MTISVRYRHGVNTEAYSSQINRPIKPKSRMRCGVKTLAVCAFLVFLLVVFLYGMFGPLSADGKPVSITAIFQNVDSSRLVTKDANNEKVKDVPTTTVATTTTESEQSKLTFKSEYNRISNNLQNGLGADDVFFGNFLPQQETIQEKDISLQQLGVANVQQLSNILQNSEIDSDTGQHLLNVVPKDMQIRLQNVNHVGHRPIPSLHVKKVNDIMSYQGQPKGNFANPGGAGGVAVEKHDIHPMFKFAHHPNAHKQMLHQNTRY